MDNKFDKYNDEVAFRTAYLVAGYIRGTLSQAEHTELDEWVAASDENMQLFERLTDEKNIEAVSKQWMEEKKISEALKRTKEKINFSKEPGRSVLFRFLPYAVAASIILVAGILIYNYKVSNNEKENMVIATNSADILPGTDMATLNLGNGKVILLDRSGMDTALGEGINIIRQQGEIVYHGKEAAEIPAYHTLTIPRKGQYKLTLPDGTKVWLNSESSISYPTAFNGKERKVTVTGESFFEVAKNKDQPFIVEAGNMRVEAVGTQFNINAYNNEPYLSATLIEGSILVSSGENENILKPGQQAQITTHGFTIADTDLPDVIAWKDNQFKFTDAPIEVIMRQAARWYDAEIIYETRPTDHFNATVPRDVSVSKLLSYLEKTNRVHFRIENKTIIVMK